MRFPETSTPDMEPITVSFTSTTVPPNEGSDAFDDIWGSEPSSPSVRPENTPRAPQIHPSDIPRLQAEHNTSGYREGITAGKAQSLQAGFDEGYGLGAALGLKVGEILGILESIAAALEGGSSTSADRDATLAVEAEKRMDEAKRELAHENIFGTEFWEADGTWKFSVQGESDAVFADVAAAHPLIRKWSQVADGEMARWQLRRDILDDTMAGEESSTGPTTSGKPASSNPGSLAKKPLDW